jgi:hypothetical protein
MPQPRKNQAMEPMAWSKIFLKRTLLTCLARVAPVSKAVNPTCISRMDIPVTVLERSEVMKSHQKIAKRTDEPHGIGPCGQSLGV